jgi:agmatine deiminase
MPAEWEKQQAIWLAWPHQKRDWPDKFAPIPLVYAEIIRHIAATQTVRLLVKDDAMQSAAEKLLMRAHVNLGNVEFFHVPTNRVWVRDSGPIFVRRGTEKIALDWKFNAWAKYSNWQLDNKVPKEIGRKLSYKTITPTYKNKPVVLEGGAIDVNGKGLLLTTEECLLSQDVQCRNKGFTKADYERVFAQYLGIDQVIWLSHGIVGDDTHGHVDDITRFVATDSIITGVETNKSDENYSILKENMKRLKALRVGGKPLEIIELPMPKPLYFDDTRLPASYANFLICNDVVLVPTFNDAHDRIALDIIGKCFPTRETIGIHAVDLVWGFGTLHCMSQQEPV